MLATMHETLPISVFSDDFHAFKLDNQTLFTFKEYICYNFIGENTSRSW